MRWAGRFSMGEPRAACGVVHRPPLGSLSPSGGGVSAEDLWPTEMSPKGGFGHPPGCLFRHPHGKSGGGHSSPQNSVCLNMRWRDGAWAPVHGRPAALSSSLTPGDREGMARKLLRPHRSQGVIAAGGPGAPCGWVSCTRVSCAWASEAGIQRPGFRGWA